MVFKKQQSYLLDDMRTFTVFGRCVCQSFNDSLQKRMNNAYLRESDVKNLLLEESTNLRKKSLIVVKRCESTWDF